MKIIKVPFLGRFRAIHVDARGWPFFWWHVFLGILFGDFPGKDRGVGLWKQTGGMRDLYVSCWGFSKDCMFFLNWLVCMGDFLAKILLMTHLFDALFKFEGLRGRRPRKTTSGWYTDWSNLLVAVNSMFFFLVLMSSLEASGDRP